MVLRRFARGRRAHGTDRNRDLAITRRVLLQSGAALAAAPVLPLAAGLSPLSEARAQAATGPAWRHGLSLFGNVKYPDGFKHFEYVNPAAPKAGTVQQFALGTFDSFNIVVSGVKGSIAGAVGFIYESLTTPALDEVSTEYGLLAEAVR